MIVKRHSVAELHLPETPSGSKPPRFGDCPLGTLVDRLNDAGIQVEPRQAWTNGNDRDGKVRIPLGENIPHDVTTNSYGIQTRELWMNIRDEKIDYESGRRLTVACTIKHYGHDGPFETIDQVFEAAYRSIAKP